MTRDDLLDLMQAWILRALHQPVQDGLGYLDDGSYGTISPACSTCGTHDEYAVPWPCPTARAVALTETEETADD